VHVDLGLKHDADSSIELWGAERRSALFEEVYRRRLALHVDSDT
jgi:hypothetical protein